MLDPFCGCGTAVAAAQKLGRRWIGIDITFLSISLQRSRLQEMFPGLAFRVLGQPESVGAARYLAQHDRFQFEWWALSLVGARPSQPTTATKGKKGADRGVDGIINFMDDTSGKVRRALVQVKSGKASVRDVRDLRGTLEREKAALGLLPTLEAPTEPMEQEAVEAGFYHSPGWYQKYPRVQILTVEALLGGAKPQMPPAWGTFKQAERVAEPGAVQDIGIVITSEYHNDPYCISTDPARSIADFVHDWLPTSPIWAQGVHATLVDASSNIRCLRRIQSPSKSLRPPGDDHTTSPACDSSSPNRIVARIA